MSRSDSSNAELKRNRTQRNPRSLANLRPAKPGEVRNPQGRNGTELFRPAISRRVTPKDADDIVDRVKSAARDKRTRLADRIKAAEFLRDTHDGKPLPELREVKFTTATEVQTESGPQRVVMQLEYRE